MTGQRLNRPLDQFTTVGGNRVRYWQVGKEGPAVVLIHGLGCSVLEWEHCIHVLGEQYQVYAPDLLGFGLTDKPIDASYDVATLAGFTLGFMDAMGLSAASLVGNSLGGRVAIECAAVAPERVRALVLSAPAAMDNPTLINLRVASLPLLGALLARPTAHGTRELWKAAVADPLCVTEQLVREKCELGAKPGASAAFLKTLRGLLHLGGFQKPVIADSQAKARRVQVPTCIVWGRQDRFLPVSHLDTLMRLMPHAKPVVLETCGHVPMVERPVEFNSIVLDFLSHTGDSPRSG